MAQITETIQGIIGRVNEHGFTLEGRQGWLNLSKYATPAPSIPEPGTPVAVAIDKAGFVRSVEPIPPVRQSTPAAPNSHAAPPDAPAPEPEPFELGDSEPVATAPATRDAIITRLAVLKAAVKYCEPDGDADENTVLRVAERFEEWATRPVAVTR